MYSLFIFIINHCKEFLLNNTLHSTIISISSMGVYFIEIFAIIYRSDRISNGYIVNELVIKLEILNEIEREWINSKLEWHSGLCL